MPLSVKQESGIFFIIGYLY